ncbi:MAG: PSD1 and planctomycete cytochrome C domain-containing protein [Actinomycetota bacterium]
MSALRFSVPLAVASLSLLGLAGAALGAAAPKVDFTRDVQPLLKARCLACHGANQAQGGLRLNLQADAFRGGDSGAVIKPGHAADSLLIHLVSGADPKRVMPPAGPRLTPAQIKVLRDWVNQGALWPEPPPLTKGEPRGVNGAQTKHWAFQPVKRPAAPKVKNAGWVRNPIDAFVLARLEKEKITPAAGADRPTLIRRLSLDLLGLPPTAAEVTAFVNDGSPDAYEKVVDRLLASPHFGERWGRHWLDLARYADSDGYEKDSPRPYAYLYRDWVIDALNQDMPFDQFTIEQLAGDLVVGSTDQRDNGVKGTPISGGGSGVLGALDERQRRLIATGFHRNTLKNREGGVDQEEDRVKATVDRANTTGTAWLGLTVGCAQCHSHKYDPITQREYYGLYAFFNTVSDVDLPLTHPASAAASVKKPATEPKAQTLAENPKPPATHVLIRGDFLRPGDPVQPHVPAVLPAVNAAAPTRLDLARWLVDPANPLTSRVTVNRVWQHLFGRGLVGTPDDFGVRGEKPTHPELLDWLAVEFMGQRDNGSTSRRPASRAIDPLTHSSIDLPGSRWSLKSLIRLVVTSATYRQSSRARPELEERDPLNLLLARQNRFRPEAEVVRDLYLAASGLLSPKVGGPSIRPPLPGDIAALGYAGSVKWQETTGPDRYARGMYIFFQRTVPYPQLVEFDAPDGNNTCTRRERSNTPLQALTLLNDPVFVECAQALGLSLLREPSGSVDSRVRLAFRTCVSREPTPQEAQRLKRLYDEMLRLCKADPASAAKLVGKALPTGTDPAEAAAWTTLARTVLNLDEFITRE